MQPVHTHDTDPVDALPIPKHAELITLSLKLEQLQSTGEIADAVLAARSLDYVNGLIAELDRVRPRKRRRAA